MRALIAVVTALAALGCAPARADCKKAARNQECLGCANMIVQMKDARSGTTVRAVVQGPGLKPPEGVLVEVFRRSESDAPLWNEETTARRTRVAACFVGKDGRFSIHLQPGKYEMRFSISNGWNCTFQRIEVIKGFYGKPLQVHMTLGM